MVTNGNFLLVASDQPDYQNLHPYLTDVSDWKQLAVHLLPREHISLIDEIDRTYKGDVGECRWELIRKYLRVGEVSWNKVIYALEKSDHPNIAKKIKKEVLKIDDVVNEAENVNIARDVVTKPENDSEARGVATKPENDNDLRNGKN